MTDNRHVPGRKPHVRYGDYGTPLHRSLPQMLHGDLAGIAWNNGEDGHDFCTGTHDGIRRLGQASVKNIVEEVQGL